MKNLLSTLGRLSLVLAGAWALASCNRAEYATLPRSTPYLGSIPVAAAPHLAAATAAPTTAPAQPPASAPTQAEALVVAPKAAAPAATPGTPAAAPVATAPAVGPTASGASPRKLNLVQRLAMAKVTKKLTKVAARLPQLRQPGNTAGTTKGRGGLDENLRIALLFAITSLGVAIVAAIVNSGFLYTAATLLFVVALVFVILWALYRV